MRSWVLTLALFLSPWTLANDVPVFDGAELVESRQTAQASYLLAHGTMKKVDGRWRAEQQTRFEGDLQRLTYLVGKDWSVDEVFSFYLQHYTPVVQRDWYRCEGLDCGSSAQWANLVFGVRELYGPDRQQRYAAWSVMEDGQEKIVAVYVVQRGNRNVYAQIDTLTLPHTAGTAAEMMQTLGVFYADEEPGIDTMRNFTARIKTLMGEGWQVIFVGHNYQINDLDEAIEQSGAAAHALLQQMQKQYPFPEGVQYRGIGPLAGGENIRSRVEVIAIDAAR